MACTLLIAGAVILQRFEPRASAPLTEHASPNLPQGLISPSINPAAFLSLHAVARSSRPFADVGKMRSTIVEADSRDLADDSKLETN